MRAKKIFRSWLIAAFVLAFSPYWLIAEFAPPDTALFFSVLVIFILEPLCAVVGGVLAGFCWKKLWSLPLITAGFFWLGVTLFLGHSERSFLVYAGVYLVLGLGAMGITAAAVFSWKTLKKFTKGH